MLRQLSYLFSDVFFTRRQWLSSQNVFSLMLDRLFKWIGLSGRAVIPMVLSLGCDTMATMVTRTLETKRERLIATFLLSLAVPCAAQWRVILGLLAQNPLALLDREIASSIFVQS